MRRHHELLLVLALAACASNSKPAAPVASVSAEENIQVCVIDTIAPGGTMLLGAIQVRATNDTLVLQSNGRVPLRQAVTGPKVLADATWLANKQPVLLTLATGRVRFVPAGAPRALVPSAFMLLAMMRGVPLFAPLKEATPMRAELEALAARGVDLEKALQQRVTLRRQMERVHSLYVPTSLVGCVFQPYARVSSKTR